MMPSRLLIRADATIPAGTGHVMRCLALAQEWGRTDGEALFAQAASTPALEQRVDKENLRRLKVTAAPGSLDDAKQTIEFARACAAEWVVADGYHFNAEYQHRIKDAGLKLLFVDDHGHASQYWADYILNQNISANPKWYSNREPYTQLLLGTQYTLLRKEFGKWWDWKREIVPIARKILVTLGGSDPHNITQKVVAALSSQQNREIECIVLVGGSNQHISELQSQCRNSGPSIRLILDADNMPELMAWADVAISASGTTSWELAFMGLPNLLIIFADNQKLTAEALQKKGVSVFLGFHTAVTRDRVGKALAELILDHDKRLAMSEQGRRLVDGRGAKRVAANLRAPALVLRRARPDDSRLLWEWANDPEARRISFSQDPISWETHLQRFSKDLASPNSFIYIAENGDGTPIGQIRYDIKDQEASVSVSLAKAARGRGNGVPLIIRGTRRCFADSRVKAIHAYIKPENEISLQAFGVAGYSEGAAVQINGQPAKQFVFPRP